MIVYVLYAMIKRQSAHLSAAGIRRQALQNISNATTSTAESKKTPLIERDNYLGV